MPNAPEATGGGSAAAGYASGRPRGRPAQYPGLTKHTLMLLEPHRRLLTTRGGNWSELVRAAIIVCYGSPAELLAVPAEYQRAIGLQAETATRLAPVPGPKPQRRRTRRPKGVKQTKRKTPGGQRGKTGRKAAKRHRPQAARALRGATPRGKMGAKEASGRKKAARRQSRSKRGRR